MKRQPVVHLQNVESVADSIMHLPTIWIGIALACFFTMKTDAETPKTVTVRLLASDGSPTEPTAQAKIVKSDQDWQEQLGQEAYIVARGKGTEHPFCGAFFDHKKTGHYFCTCCALPLFVSDAKFDSGTGWPSFFKSFAPENVVVSRDASHGMVREEILCARCDAHLGHVFNDGPPPTGLRYCVNSVSLRFVEKKP